jgi:hypothetical protein
MSACLPRCTLYLRGCILLDARVDFGEKKTLSVQLGKLYFVQLEGELEPATIALIKSYRIFKF